MVPCLLALLGKTLLTRNAPSRRCPSAAPSSASAAPSPYISAVSTSVIPRSRAECNAAIAIAVDAAERSGKPYDGAVALGCVIRGETLHFEIVSQESARALLDLAVTRRFPIGNGILTVDTDAQAWSRARPDEADKGGDAARAALSLVRLARRVAAGRP